MFGREGEEGREGARCVLVYHRPISYIGRGSGISGWVPALRPRFRPIAHR